MKRGFVPLLLGIIKTISCFVLIIANANAALADEQRAVLLYPELRAPFSNVFEEMIKGVESGFEGELQRVRLKKNTSVDEIKEIIAKTDPGLVFALGKRSLESVKTIDQSAPILAAGITRNGPDTTGISMLPDPWVVFEKLFLIKGHVDNVFVVSRGDRYDEQLDRAEAFLNTAGSNLVSSRVSSIQDAAKAYREILNKVKPGEAIWILPGAPYLDNSVLSVILEYAWKRRILVFSSNPSHVKRGVLFAVYPDNRGMGNSLGQLGNQIVTRRDEVVNGLQPLQDVLLAVNERTTKHLGINLGDEARSEIDLMLPAR